jgi:hypothetical protein
MMAQSSAFLQETNLTTLDSWHHACFQQANLGNIRKLDDDGRFTLLQSHINKMYLIAMIPVLSDSGLPQVHLLLLNCTLRLHEDSTTTSIAAMDFQYQIYRSCSMPKIRLFDQS